MVPPLSSTKSFLTGKKGIGKNPFGLFLRSAGTFNPKVRFSFDSGSFTVKTAESERELKEIFTLRHRVFYEEMTGESSVSGMDTDSFDYKCDHIVLFDNDKCMAVGTYRVNSSIFTGNFYSGTEFQIGRIKKIRGNKLELGRACVAPEYRGSAAVGLLWKGIAEYVNRTRAEYLFGCSSLCTEDAEKAASVYRYFRDSGFLKPDSIVSPRGKFRFRKFSNFVRFQDFLGDEPEKSAVPPLLSFYLKLGAEIMGEPAFDAKFKCFDFFTFIDLKKIPHRKKRRFGLN
ncbi:MAG: GNAT family N-acetyltransferase [Fibrobacterota bacterium]